MVASPVGGGSRGEGVGKKRGDVDHVCVGRSFLFDLLNKSLAFSLGGSVEVMDLTLCQCLSTTALPPTLIFAFPLLT